MKKHNKWLLRKISRSKTEYWYRPRYADDRNNKKPDFEDLPQRESVKKRRYNVDTTLVKRWLYSQVGLNFDDVYSAFIARVQPKYLDQYRDCIYYYVTKGHEVDMDKNGLPWRKFTQRYYRQKALNKGFYIHPDSNILCRTPQESRRGKYRRLHHQNLGSFFCYPNSKKWQGTFKHKEYPFEIYIDTKGGMLEKDSLDTVTSLLTGFDSFLKKSIKQLKDFAKYYRPKDSVDDKIWHVVEACFNTSNPKKFTLLVEGKENDTIWRIHYEGREIQRFEILGASAKP